ncbi:MAG: GntR family transcriptional regulator [Terriglobia bacterium]
MRLRIAKSITQRTYEIIRAQILRGELNASRRLTEAYFAKLFGISKSPVREALNRLEAEGLITIRPRRGAFVRDFSTRDTEEIYELREILETSAVRNVELDSKVVAELHAAVDEAEAYLRQNNREKYVCADAHFHRILAQANPNSRLRKALESMHDQMLILRHKTFALSGRNSVKQHRQIVQALEQGHREAAAQLMGEHIRAVRRRLLEDIQQRNAQSAPRQTTSSRSVSARSEQNATVDVPAPSNG